MKINVITLLIALIISIPATLLAQNPYQITGKLTGVPDGAVIALMRNEGNLLTTIGVDTLKNGLFNFTGNIDQLTPLALLGFSDGFPSQRLDVWVKSGSKVNINGSNQLLKTWTVKSNIPEQADQNKLILIAKKQYNEIQVLNAQEPPLFAQLEKADRPRLLQIKNKIDSLRTIQDSLQSIITNKELELLSSSKKRGLVYMATLKGLALTTAYTKDSTLKPKVIALYRKLKPENRDNLDGAEIYNLLYPPVVVKKGEKIPDTLLNDLNDKQHQLADYKGKYLLVDFWSIGCGPCIQAMPEMKKLHGKHPEKLAVISLTLDKSKETWQRASKELDISWTNLSDGKGSTGLAAKYGVRGIPHYAIVSPEGILLDSWAGYGNDLLEKKIAEYIK